MKIVKEEQNLMVIKNKNTFVFLVGITFALTGFLTILKPDIFINQPPLWSSIVGILLGSFIILVTKTTTINLNKTSNQIIFTHKTLFRQTITQHNLQQIKKIELQTIYNSSNKSSGYSYRLIFELNNGKQIPLNSQGSSIIRIMGKQIIVEKKIGTKIANFLNIPFQEKRPPTLKETLSVVQSAIQSAAEKEMQKPNSDA